MHAVSGMAMLPFSFMYIHTYVLVQFKTCFLKTYIAAIAEAKWDKKWTCASGIVSTEKCTLRNGTCPVSKTGFETCLIHWLTLRSASRGIYSSESRFTGHIPKRNITAATPSSALEHQVQHLNTQCPLTVGHLHREITMLYLTTILVYTYIYAYMRNKTTL